MPCLVWDLHQLACVLSYLKAQLFPIQPEKSFADWVTNRFGSKLFHIFFKTYTEKVWGMPCSEISADWAAQRIKGLSLFKAVVNALVPRNGKSGTVVKTLIDQFEYPRLGPGMMWEKTRDDLLRQRAKLRMGEEVVRIQHDSGRVFPSPQKTWKGGSKPTRRMRSSLRCLCATASWRLILLCHPLHVKLPSASSIAIS